MTHQDNEHDSPSARAARLLSETFTRCGLNADWCVDTWRVDRSLALYITEDEDGADNFSLVRRIENDNPVVEPIATMHASKIAELIDLARTIVNTERNISTRKIKETPSFRAAREVLKTFDVLPLSPSVQLVNADRTIAAIIDRETNVEEMRAILTGLVALANGGLRPQPTRGGHPEEMEFFRLISRANAIVGPVDHRTVPNLSAELLGVLQVIYANAAESPEWIRNRIAPAIAKAEKGGAE